MAKIADWNDAVGYRNDLLKLVQRSNPDLAELKSLWDQIESKANKSRQQVIQDIPRNDPLRLKVDLLRPMARIKDENLHTRVLAYLLDENNGHGFGRGVLIPLLEKINSLCQHPASRAASSKARHLCGAKQTKVSVIPEYRFPVKRIRNRSAGRNDIVVEFRATDCAVLVVIENKIEALVRKGQLETYETESRNWCKRERTKGKSTYALHILLTRETREEQKPEENWVTLTYLNLASILRNSFFKYPEAKGRQFLQLYIASITNGLLGIDIDQPHYTELTDFQTYRGTNNGKAHH
jgi:hypothetical protein